MVTFKHKNTKKFILNAKKTTTLDGKHNEYVNEFKNNINNKIPLLTKKKNSLKRKIKNSVTNKELTIEAILDIKEQIKTISKEIKITKSKEKDYYLTNSELIFDYFEEKKKLSEGNNKLTCIDAFFNINNINDSKSRNKNKNNNVNYKMLPIILKLLLFFYLMLCVNSLTPMNLPNGNNKKYKVNKLSRATDLKVMTHSNIKFIMKHWENNILKTSKEICIEDTYILSKIDIINEYIKYEKNTNIYL